MCLGCKRDQRNPYHRLLFVWPADWRSSSCTNHETTQLFFSCVVHNCGVPPWSLKPQPSAGVDPTTGKIEQQHKYTTTSGRCKNFAELESYATSLGSFHGSRAGFTLYLRTKTAIIAIGCSAKLLRFSATTSRLSFACSSANPVYKKVPESYEDGYFHPIYLLKASYNHILKHLPLERAFPPSP